MGCCKKNEEYRCGKCGCGMRVTEEPREDASANQGGGQAPKCPCCGSGMEKKD